MAVDATLNPTQRATLAALGAGDAGARTTFDPHLGPALRDVLDDGLADIEGDLDAERPLIVTKHLLNGVHGCQARWLHERDEPFVPTVPIVRGTIAHKALELAIHWPGTPLPLDLVDAAIERIDNADHWATEFISTMRPVEHAELRASAADIVTKFVETWPPLTAAMRPATEARMWADVCDGRVTLKGQADLTLGQAVASGSRARKIIVDYKTGNRSPEHRGDLRFYALVETLRVGVPPRLLVTAYLASGEIETETVTEGVLEATVARVVDGIRGVVALTSGDAEPIRRPSMACTWCPLLDECEIGRAFLDQAR